MGTKPRAKMPVAERAKQFMPFAAVSGLNDALAAKERELGLAPKVELSEEAAAALNACLTALRPGDRVSLAFYRAGETHLLRGRLRRIDSVRRTMEIDGECVLIDDLLRIEKLPAKSEE